MSGDYPQRSHDPEIRMQRMGMEVHTGDERRDLYPRREGFPHEGAGKGRAQQGVEGRFAGDRKAFQQVAVLRDPHAALAITPPSGSAFCTGLSSFDTWETKLLSRASSRGWSVRRTHWVPRVQPFGSSHILSVRRKRGSCWICFWVGPVLPDDGLVRILPFVEGKGGDRAVQVQGTVLFCHEY